MEPRIQYAKASDGVSIAFWTLGEGRPLVYMANPPFTHIRGEWQNPEMGTFYRRLAECCRLIRYDRRGCGLSDRLYDFSLGATIRDLESVVEGLGLERFALLGIYGSGTTAIAYAVDRPDCLTHLILQNCYSRGADFFKILGMQALSWLAGSDWEMFTETAAHALLGWSAGEPANRMAAYFRECVSKEAVVADYAARQADDVSDLLPHVRTPTLVIRNGPASVGPDVMGDLARALASGIVGARLAVIDQGWAMDVNAEVQTIEEFLSEGEVAAPQPVPSGMTAILFADIADSTGLTERLGDAAFRARARELDTALRGVIRENGGAPVDGKLLGDGVLAVFTSARQAIEAALACGSAGDGAGLALHLGLHAGDVIREESNVYGGAVNIAARISALSSPGEVLVSDTLRGLARTSAGAAFEDRGDHELKGVSEPVRVWAVVERGSGSTPHDSSFREG